MCYISRLSSKHWCWMFCQCVSNMLCASACLSVHPAFGLQCEKWYNQPLLRRSHRPQADGGQGDHLQPNECLSSRVQREKMLLQREAGGKWCPTSAVTGRGKAFFMGRLLRPLRQTSAGQSTAFPKALLNNPWVTCPSWWSLSCVTSVAWLPKSW